MSRDSGSASMSTSFVACPYCLEDCAPDQTIASHLIDMHYHEEQPAVRATIAAQWRVSLALILVVHGEQACPICELIHGESATHIFGTCRSLVHHVQGVHKRKIVRPSYGAPELIGYAHIHLSLSLSLFILLVMYLTRTCVTQVGCLE